jgi:hypothetical protein
VQALLAVCPSPDEVLLARLAQSHSDGPSVPKRKVDTAKAPKRKATMEDTSSGKHNKRYAAILFLRLNSCCMGKF